MKNSTSLTALVVFLSTCHLYGEVLAYPEDTHLKPSADFQDSATSRSRPFEISQVEISQNSTVYFLTLSDFEEIMRILDELSASEERGNFAAMVPLIEELISIEKSSNRYEDPLKVSLTSLIEQEGSPGDAAVRQIRKLSEIYGDEIADTNNFLLIENGREDQIITSLIAAGFLRNFTTLSFQYAPGTYSYQGLNSNPDPAQAEFLLEAAIQIGETYLNEYLTSDPINALSLLRRDQGDVPGYLESTEALSQTEDPRYRSNEPSFVANMHANMAISAIDIGDFERAERLLLSIPEAEEENAITPGDAMVVHSAYILLYTSTDRYDQAIAYINTALADLSVRGVDPSLQTVSGPSSVHV